MSRVMKARTPTRLARRQVMSRRRLYGHADLGRARIKDRFDPARPERHYMRGPGPKWHERHAHASTPIAYTQAELARAAACPLHPQSELPGPGGPTPAPAV